MAQTRKGSVDNSLRVLTSNLHNVKIKKGDIVECYDLSPSPLGRVPRTLTLGKEYEVLGVNKCIICVQNDRGDFVSYYSTRFKKVQKRKRKK